jgi:hypothetical protein
MLHCLQRGYIRIWFSLPKFGSKSKINVDVDGIHLILYMYDL